MSPRFVDMNADGFADLVLGSYDGVPQIVFGSKGGLGKAEVLEDREQQPIAISKFYDWDKGPKRGWNYRIEGSRAHGTSVSPVDWEGDGDFDLLISESYKGGLYVCINVGTAKEPSFDSKNIRVDANGYPEGGVSDALTADWNGDGLFDILLGGKHGGIFLLINEGELSEPRFGKVQTLVGKPDEKCKGQAKRDARVKTFNNQPIEPGSSNHLEVVDYDHDGDLDLLVGSRCIWDLDKPVGLTADDKETLANLQDRFEKLQGKMDEAYSKLPDTKDEDERAAVIEMAGELQASVGVIYEKIRKLKGKDATFRRSNNIWLLRQK